VIARLRLWFRQRLCAFEGHDRLPVFAPDRMFLKCVSCGHETPGWAIDDNRKRAAA